jgi:hypothetical protein
MEASPPAAAAAVTIIAAAAAAGAGPPGMQRQRALLPNLPKPKQLPNLQRLRQQQHWQLAAVRALTRARGGVGLEFGQV